MTSMPDVRFSIVIPTYNAGQFIEKAVRSVLDQGIDDIEILVVDNGSTDNTVAIVRSFNDPRITIFDIDNQGVIAKSRNKGMAHAVGDWICFLDADDYWEQGKLDAVAALPDNADIFCHGEYWRVGDAVVKQKTYGPASRSGFESLLFTGNCFSTSAMAVRRHLIERTDGFCEAPISIGAEDYHFWMTLARLSPQCVFDDRMLGNYLIHPGGQSKVYLRQLKSELWVVGDHFRQIDRPNLRTRLRYGQRVAMITIKATLRFVLGR